MPKRFISTGELDSHVIVPISKQLIFNLIREMGYDNIFKDKVYFQNDFLTDSEHGKDDGTAYINDNRVVVVIKPVLNPTAVKWAPNTSNYRMGAGYSPYDLSTNPVFCNKSINCIVRESLIPCTIQLEIKFVLLSRSNAYDLLNRLYTKYATGEMIIVNDIVYEYKVPDDIMSLIYHLYKMSMPHGANKEEYLSNFMRWTKEYSANKMMLVYNRHISDRKEICIRKNGFQMIGQIDLSSDSPDANKNNQSTKNYEISLVYTFQFNRPAALIADYPVICNNELVPDVFLSYDLKDKYKKYPMPINHYMDHVKDSFKIVPDGYEQIIRLPWYDDWKVPVHAGLYRFGYIPFLLQVFTLDDIDNPEGITEINLEDGFDEYELTDHVLKSIKDLGGDALLPWGKFMVQVFANDDLVDPSMLVFDGSKLIIKNRDYTKQYHLILSKREGDYGINQTKRVWICDLIVRRK